MLWGQSGLLLVRRVVRGGWIGVEDGNSKESEKGSNWRRPGTFTTIQKSRESGGHLSFSSTGTCLCEAVELSTEVEKTIDLPGL